MGPRPWDSWSRTALAALLTGGAALVASLKTAVDLDPLPRPSAGRQAFELSDLPAPDPDVTAYAVLKVTENNPFRPDRHRPQERYLPPAQRMSASQITARPSILVPSFDLRGIAWAPGGGGLAVLGLAGRPARLLRQGATIESFRVESIDPGSVTLVGADTTVVLTLQDPAGPARASGSGGRVR